MIKRLFAKNILIQILHYFSILIAAIILVYGVLYIIYSKHFNNYIEITKGALTYSIILKDMLCVACTTIFPIIVPFVIVFGYMKSKYIYIPVVAMMLFIPFIPFIYRAYQVYILQIYLINIIFGILLAHFFKLFLWAIRKIENKIHDILIFLLKALILLVIVFFVFYITYFMFIWFFRQATIAYFYAYYSWNLPPTGPYYLFSLSIIISFFLGLNKKYLIYNGCAILLSLILFINAVQLPYDIRRLYTVDAFGLAFIYNFFLSWQYHDILLLLLMFFSSSFLFIFISDKINKRQEKNKKQL